MSAVSRSSQEGDGSFEARRAAVVSQVIRRIESVSLAAPDEDALLEALSAVVRFQLAENEPLRRFWRGRGFDGTFDDPVMIPAVPTDVFRHIKLFVGEKEPKGVFRTSGTTDGARGEHYHYGTEAYDVGAVRQFERWCVPDGVVPRFVGLVFDPKEVGDSSLSHMVGLLAERCGVGEARFLLDPHDGLDTGRAWSLLRAAQEPLLIFGTAFAFVELLDAGSERVALPAGSRIVETGGFKGKSREVPRAEPYGELSRRLGVAPRWIASEYSMTELSSQLYSRGLRDAWSGRAGDKPDGSLLVPPPWLWVDVVEPNELRPLPQGERGLLRFVDLANVDSVIAVQTSDLGEVTEDGVRLYGRAAGSRPRGCSLAVEEIRARTASAASGRGEGAGRTADDVSRGT